MPLWQIIAIIMAAWLVAVAGIVVFMMGASRGRRAERRSERVAQQQRDRHRLQPVHRDGRAGREDPQDTP